MIWLRNSAVKDLVEDFDPKSSEAWYKSLPEHDVADVFLNKTIEHLPNDLPFVIARTGDLIPISNRNSCKDYQGKSALCARGLNRILEILLRPERLYFAAYPTKRLRGSSLKHILSMSTYNHLNSFASYVPSSTRPLRL